MCVCVCVCVSMLRRRSFEISATAKLMASSLCCITEVYVTITLGQHNQTCLMTSTERWESRVRKAKWIIIFQEASGQRYAKKSKYATTWSGDIPGTAERTSVLNELHLWNCHFANTQIFDNGFTCVISWTFTWAFPLALRFKTNTTLRKLPAVTRGQMQVFSEK